MSQIQQGMALLIAAFYKYSGKEGDKTTLSKGELKDMLTAELGDILGKSSDKTTLSKGELKDMLTAELSDILGKSSDKAALDKIFKDLDANADGTVDFQEYITLVACITMLCNEFFTKK
uniref:Protein S100 n=1 Tax=Cyprinus carpio carpio TaxID=630221 RepID=A0A9J7ZD22_CYPCA